MTALTDGLREWWRHRNDPPAMLPDPVRWTYWCPDDENTARIIATHRAEGWTVAEFDSSETSGEPDTARIVFRREDGAYRWRDDGFEGF